MKRLMRKLWFFCWFLALLAILLMVANLAFRFLPSDSKVGGFLFFTTITSLLAGGIFSFYSQEIE